MPDPLAAESSADAGTNPAPLPLVSESDMVNPLLTAAEVMTEAPRTCSPFSSVLEAVMIFRDASCGVVPVVDAGATVGVLTDRDVALALAEHPTGLADVEVSQIMSKNVVTVAGTATLAAAIQLMGDNGVSRLVVVDADSMLVGVMSWTDLIPHVSEAGLGHVVARVIGGRS